MTLYGWDASHYDAVPDPSRVYAEGFRFMTHKIGGDANDAEAAPWWSAFKGWRDRMLLGGYWVLYPGNPSGRADAFLARLDAVCPGWRDGPFILQIDAEIWGGDKGTKPSISECNAFADRLVQKVPKLMPIGYLPKWVYPDVSAFRYPIWSSRYVTGSGTASELYPGDNSSLWSGYGKPVSILQFTSSATIAGQTTCDANAYRGTLAELTALLAPGWSKDMTTLDQDDIDAVAKAVWNYPLEDPYDTNKPKRTVTAGGWQRYSPARSQTDTGIPQAGGLARSFNDFLAQYAADQQAIGSTIRQAVTDAIAALPIPPGGLSKDDVVAAINQAFSTAFPSSPAS